MPINLQIKSDDHGVIGTILLKTKTKTEAWLQTGKTLESMLFKFCENYTNFLFSFLTMLNVY